MFRWRVAFFAVGGLFALAARAEAPATFSAWDVRDVEHPILGAIKVAVPQSGVTTRVKGSQIVSAAFVSCEKATGTIAIELANSVESDTKGGLPPVEMPRMVCNGRASGAPARTAIRAKWTTNELGDVMARGLSAAELRRCGAIDIEQEVALPPGAALASQRIALRLLPATTDIASVLACGSAGQAAEVAPAAAPARPKASPAAVAVDAPWRPARTVPGSRSNVRAAPRMDGRLVKQLPAGTRLLAQKAEGDWWRVKPARGATFSGYIRADRLEFR